MSKQDNVINLNFPTEDESVNRNYQLIRNDVIELDNDSHITSYSIMVNSVSGNRVTQSEYLCDVSRDAEQARMIFELIAVGNAPGELLDEIAEEILG